MTKNEGLTLSLRGARQRFEKYKTEQSAQQEKEVAERDNEISILKEMIKANQF
jgi:hypothetical protein